MPITKTARKFLENLKYSSTQITLQGSLRDKVLNEARKIKTEDLHENSRDPDPHVTVKYGLHTVFPIEVQALLGEIPKVKFRFGKITTFTNPEDFDVVKIEIEDVENLRKLNRKISNNLECTDTYPKYKPHCTLAYVKKGKGKDYIGECSLTGKVYEADSFIFSGKEGHRSELSLGVSDLDTLGFIGVDFDGTLAHYDKWRGWDKLGKPVKAMVNKVKEKLKQGEHVKIFTARHSGPKRDKIKSLLQKWCRDNGLPVLEVTNEKTPGMHEIWDDRAFGVVKNTGRFK